MGNRRDEKLGRRARAAVAANVVLLLVEGANILGLWDLSAGLERAIRRDVFSSDELLDIERLSQLFAIVLLVATVVAAILFLRWIYTAHERAMAIGRKDCVRTPPRQAVVAFFIPVVNLFRPYEHTDNLLAASDPEDLELPPSAAPPEGAFMGSLRREKDWERPRVSVAVWWAAATLGNFIAVFALYRRPTVRHASSIALLQQMIASSQLSILRGLAQLVTSVFAILLVRGITGNLAERSRRLRLRRQWRREQSRVAEREAE